MKAKAKNCAIDTQCARAKLERRTGSPAKITHQSSSLRTRMIAQAEIQPLQVMLDTMADRWRAALAEPDQKTRWGYQDEACAVAEKVAPYFHPKLQATTVKAEGGQPLALVLNLPTADVLRSAIRGECAPLCAPDLRTIPSDLKTNDK